MSATPEQAMIAQAGPYMLAARAKAMVATEVDKGCDSLILPQALALEPPYAPITGPKEIASVCQQADWLYEPIPTTNELLRGRVWISPDQEFSWDCCELFVKQLVSVSHRMGLEIIGNQENILVQLLCHQSDAGIVATAFQGKFQQCRLSWLSTDQWPQIDRDAWATIRFCDYFPSPPYHHLLTMPDELHISPFESLMIALADIQPPAIGLYQVLFQPVCRENNWHRNIEILMDVEYITKLVANVGVVQRYAQQAPSGDLRQMSGEVASKAHNDKPIYAIAARLAVIGAGDEGQKRLQSLAVFSNLFQHGGRPLNYLTEVDYQSTLSPEMIRHMFTLGLTYRPGFLVNSAELAGLVHIPPANIVADRNISLDTMETLTVPDDALREGTPIGICNMAGIDRIICIPQRIRFRDTHLIGRPDMGKSSLEEHMILNDTSKGHGVAVLDPHGDLVERMLYLIPAGDIERVIYFDPGNPKWVPIWNPMEKVPGQDIGRIADNLVGAFKSFVTGWGDRMETMLRQTIFGLLHLSGSTFLDVSDLLRPQSPESQTLRDLLLKVIDTEEARRFWMHDYKTYRADDFAPPKHKLSKLLLGQRLPLMLSQPHSLINFRRIMDDGMILLANLTKIGVESRKTLGSFMLALLHQTALSRSEIPIADRRPFHIYMDEAYNFPTNSLEDILVETRKYGVSLTLAHQYLKQFTPDKVGALTSVGTTIIFNIDSADAAYLAKDLQKLVKVEDIVKLELGQAIVRCDTDIVRIRTPKPPEIPERHYRDQIIAQSRQRYYRTVAEVRKMIRRRGDRYQQPFTPLAGDSGDLKEHQTPPEFTYDEH